MFEVTPVKQGQAARAELPLDRDRESHGTQEPAMNLARLLQRRCQASVAPHRETPERPQWSLPLGLTRVTSKYFTEIFDSFLTSNLLEVRGS